MPRLHRQNLLFAGLLIAGTGAATATAQETPPAAPVVPAAVASATVASAGPSELMVAPPAPGVDPTAVPSPPPGTCTCGNRHGLSRWRWHRTQCKRHLQEHLIGYPEEFNEWPLGEAITLQRTQVANGLAARMIFYQYDFVQGTSQLNVRGRDKLAEVAATLPTSFFPVVVERTTKEYGVSQGQLAALDQSRRSVLLAELGRGAFPVPPERVVIGPSIAHGMTGVESMLIYGRQLQSLGSGGSVGAATGSPAGFDAGGLSGSAVSSGATGR